MSIRVNVAKSPVNTRALRILNLDYVAADADEF